MTDADAIEHSCLLVIGGVLVHPDAPVRATRAAWVARQDPAAWRTLGLRTLAQHVGQGVEDHDELVAAMVAEDVAPAAAHDLVTRAIEAYADASEPWWSRASDQPSWPLLWREHARRVRLAGQLERLSWRLAVPTLSPLARESGDGLGVELEGSSYPSHHCHHCHH